jgi:hypothetical protein
MYNAQTPVGMGMFTSRSDMPAETPAAYPPHERTGKTAFSKSSYNVALFCWKTVYSTNNLGGRFQSWTRSGWLTQHMQTTRSV